MALVSTMGAKNEGSNGSTAALSDGRGLVGCGLSSSEDRRTGSALDALVSSDHR